MLSAQTKSIKTSLLFHPALFAAGRTNARIAGSPKSWTANESSHVASTTGMPSLSAPVADRLAHLAYCLRKPLRNNELCSSHRGQT
jgi:hypothetical protein